MKQVLLPTLLIATIYTSTAQEPTEGKVNYHKKDVPAAIIELPYRSDVVENAIKDYLYRKGVKGGTYNDFTVFKGVKLHDGDNENSDVYFKVDKKSNKEKDATIVYLFTTRSNEEPATLEAEDLAVYTSKDLLKEMVSPIGTYNLGVEIDQQDASVKRAIKKYESLEDDGRDIEKKIKKLQDDLDQNRRNLTRQKDEIENQKKVLETLKGRKVEVASSN